jgi:hypothetical protein
VAEIVALRDFADTEQIADTDQIADIEQIADTDLTIRSVQRQADGRGTTRRKSVPASVRQLRELVREAGGAATEAADVPGERAARQTGERGALRTGERAPLRTSDLAALRTSGLVRPASAPADPVDLGHALPVIAPLARLLPGGLRRGSTVAVAAGEPSRAPGATSLLLTLLTAASAAGSWCAVVGLPTLGLVAAEETGLVLSRVALVPSPGPDWVGVVAALLDGVDLVVAATAGPVPAGTASRLAARARQRGSVLLAYGPWPGADLTLAVADADWHGLGQGRGRLRRHELTVAVSGRGGAARPRRAVLQLPLQVDQPGPPERSTHDEKRREHVA